MSGDKTAENQFGYVKGDKVYRNPFLDQPELEIGVVREDPEKSLDYFIERFKSFESKVDSIEASIKEATNKGSYLMKLIHLKEKLATYNGLGDFEALIKRIDVLKEDLDKSINENRVRNLDLKKGFLDELKEILKVPDDQVLDALEKVKENKSKWLRTGSVTEKEQEKLEKAYNDLLDEYFKRKKEIQAKQKEELKKITVHYNRLIGKLGAIRNERSDERAQKIIDDINEQWKKLPDIPDNVRAAIQRKFDKKLKDMTFQRKRGQRPRGPRHDSRGGGGMISPEVVKLKEELLNQAYALKDLDLDEAVKAAKLLQEKWLSSGRSMAPEVKTIYNRFREIIASIFERKTLEINLDKKFPDFKSKPDSEAKILKISVMRDLIRKAKTDLKLFQENLDLASSEQGEDVDKTLVTKVRNQKFRIRIRENLLQEIEMN